MSVVPLVFSGMSERRATNFPGTVTSWYVVHTHALQESRAESNLNMWGVETFNPKLKSCRTARNLQKPVSIIKPLFPCYIFARFNADSMLHKISFTRGVRKIVSFNGSPVPVTEELINLIKSRIKEDGLVRIGPSLRSGDEVVIVEGPFADLVGIFEKDVNESDRVIVFLKAVNYQSRIVIGRELVRKVS